MTPGFLSLEESNKELLRLSIRMCTLPAKDKSCVCEQNYNRMAEESCLKDLNLLLLDEILIPLEETQVDPFSGIYTWYKQQVGLARQEWDNYTVL